MNARGRDLAGVSADVPATRAELMEHHVEARRRRDAAPLASDEYRAAAEEIARIEIDIARLEEAPPAAPATG